jgi:hypothetical protein
MNDHDTKFDDFIYDDDDDISNNCFICAVENFAWLEH